MSGTNGKTRNAENLRDAQALGAALLKGELSAEVIRELPTQSIYLALQTVDLEDALEILEEIPEEKYRLILDFELWKKDNFDEERLWQWLRTLEEGSSLRPFQAFLTALDPGILGFLVSRYATVVYSEEQTDPAPGPGFFTPDRGQTWIAFNVDDQKKHTQLGKLFALLFSTDSDRFYQVLLAGSSGTTTEFEEESYQEKNRRLSTEGIPDHEASARINTGLAPERAAALLATAGEHRVIEHQPAVQPLIYQGGEFEPLMTLLAELFSKAELQLQLEAELTMVANASLVFFGIPFSERDEVARHMERIKGAINLGLQKAAELSTLSMGEIYESLGLTGLYQLGLQLLRDVQRLVRNIPEQVREGTAEADPALYLLCAAVLHPFPMVPVFFGRETAAGEALPTEVRPFSKLTELTEAERQIRGRFHH